MLLLTALNSFSALSRDGSHDKDITGTWFCDMCVDHMVTCLPGAKFADAMHYLDNFLDRTGKKAGIVLCFGIKNNGTLGNITSSPESKFSTIKSG